MNLGFSALRGGDIDTAKHSLNNQQDDWFVQYGMISIARLEGNADKVDSLCDRVLASHATHKAALFNCALHQFQTKRNFKKAKELLNNAAKASGGERHWDNRINELLDKVLLAESNVKADAGNNKKDEPKNSDASKTDKNKAKD